MQLREIMTRDVEVIRPETSVSEAAQKMRSLDLGALPVCEGSPVARPHARETTRRVTFTRTRARARVALERFARVRHNLASRNAYIVSRTRRRLGSAART